MRGTHPSQPPKQSFTKPESSAPAVVRADSCRAPPPEGHQCLGCLRCDTTVDERLKGQLYETLSATIHLTRTQRPVQFWFWDRVRLAASLGHAVPTMAFSPLLMVSTVLLRPKSEIESLNHQARISSESLGECCKRLLSCNVPAASLFEGLSSKTYWLENSFNRCPNRNVYIILAYFLGRIFAAHRC